MKPVSSNCKSVNREHEEGTEHPVEGQTDAHDKSEVVYLRPRLQQCHYDYTEVAVEGGSVKVLG